MTWIKHVLYPVHVGSAEEEASFRLVWEDLSMRPTLVQTTSSKGVLETQPSNSAADMAVDTPPAAAVASNPGTVPGLEPEDICQLH